MKIVIATAWVMAFGMACGASCAAMAPTPQDDLIYPCGPRGVSCPNHMCCWEGDECGVASCPEGMCCFVGRDLDMLGSRPRVRKQFSEK